MINFRSAVSISLSIGLLFAFAAAGCGGGGDVVGAVSTPATTVAGATSTTSPTMEAWPSSTTTSITIHAEDPAICDVTISVTSAESFGSLQFDVDYSTARPAGVGGFEGTADRVSCSNASGISGSIATYNDDEAAQTLRVGVISLAGVAAPTDIATCRYLVDGVLAPVPENFTVTLIDAADSTFIKLTPTLILTVTDCHGAL